MKLLRIDTHAHYYGDGKWIKLQYGGLLTSHNFHYNGGGGETRIFFEYRTSKTIPVFSSNF